MDKEILFAIYYSNLVGIQFHPANGILGDADRETEVLNRCAKLAQAMINITEDICLS